MKIADIEQGRKKIYLLAKVIEIKEERAISNDLKVCNVIIEDDSGQAELAVYNEQIDKLKPHAKIIIKSAYCKDEYEGMARITLGKFGTIEVLKDD